MSRRKSHESVAPRHASRPLSAVRWQLSALFILLAGLGAYANSFNGVFVLDEQTAIVDNPNIRSIATSFSAPKDVGLAGRPVVSLSFALNYLLAPRDVRDAFAVPPGADAAARDAVYRNLWGYHAVNLAIHLLAALALFGIVRRTLAGMEARATDPHSGTGVPACRSAGMEARATDPHSGTGVPACRSAGSEARATLPAAPAGTEARATGDAVGRAATPLALVVALLWVAHPLCTGSITYVAQRVESLMGLFFLLTVYCAIRAGEAAFGGGGAPPPLDGRSGRGEHHRSARRPEEAQAEGGPLGERAVPRGAGLAWSAAAVAFCALGVGTKEVMVAAPIFVVLYDLVFWPVNPPEGGSHEEGSRENHRGYVGSGFSRIVGGSGFSRIASRARAVLSARLPLYAGFVGCWIVLAFLVLSNPRSASVGAVHGWSPWLYLQTQAGVIVHYLRLAIVPWPLVLDYEWPAATSLLGVLPQLLFLGALFALTAWGLLRLKPAALLGAWFFLILAPSSSVLPIVTEIAAEHRMYLPLCAVIALVVIGGYAALLRWSEGRAAKRNSGRSPGAAERHGLPATVQTATILLAVMGVAGCVYLTNARNEDYSSYERIWADTVAQRPGNARARSNYGTVLFEQGRLPEAETQLRRALEIREAYPEAQANLGAVLCSEGRLEEGVAHLKRAITLEPGYRDAYRNLGEALASLGRNAEALDAYRRALASAPDDPRLLSRIGWLLATAPEDLLRDGRAALTAAERAVQITDGRDADSLDTLAAAYAELRQFNDAARTQERAIAAAQSSGMAGMIPDMQMRLEMYRAGQPFRQAPLQRG